MSGARGPDDESSGERMFSAQNAASDVGKPRFRDIDISKSVSDHEATAAAEMNEMKASFVPVAWQL
jgi:hypothetical protein